MRQIKFRAWDKKGKQMINNLEAMSFDNNDEIFLIKSQYDLETNPNGHNLFVYERLRFEIDLMQFTGLKDKNGREIYEGDVLGNDMGGRQMTVVFSQGSFCLDGLTPIVEPKADWTRFLEVIGNVWEHPELLK